MKLGENPWYTESISISDYLTQSIFAKPFFFSSFCEKKNIYFFHFQRIRFFSSIFEDKTSSSLLRSKIFLSFFNIKSNNNFIFDIGLFFSFAEQKFLFGCLMFCEFSTGKSVTHRDHFAFLVVYSFVGWKVTFVLMFHYYFLYFMFEFISNTVITFWICYCMSAWCIPVDQ